MNNMERNVCSIGCWRVVEPLQDSSFACCADAGRSVLRDAQEKEKKI